MITHTCLSKLSFEFLAASRQKDTYLVPARPDFECNYFLPEHSCIVLPLALVTSEHSVSETRQALSHFSRT